MNTNEMLRFILIIVAAVVFIYLIHTYNNSTQEINSPSDVESFYADGENTENSPANRNMNNSSGNESHSESQSENESENESESEHEVNNQTENSDSESENPNDPMPSEGEDNETFKTVDQNPENNENTNNKNNIPNSNRLPNECYPKDVLTPKDLLPQDSNSTWSQTVPSGQGSLGDQNFLNAGFHVGINTVGQSLRNANLQLRSEPANPQLKVSPWLQTTIEPDANRRALEIGA